MDLKSVLPVPSSFNYAYYVCFGYHGSMVHRWWILPTTLIPCKPVISIIMIPPATHETVCCANSLHCISLVSFLWNCLLCFMPSLHISLLIPKLDWSYHYRVGLRKYTSTPLGTRIYSSMWDISVATMDVVLLFCLCRCIFGHLWLAYINFEISLIGRCCNYSGLNSDTIDQPIIRDTVRPRTFRTIPHMNAWRTYFPLRSSE